MMYSKTLYRMIGEENFEITVTAELLPPEAEVGATDWEIANIKIEPETELVRAILKAENAPFKDAWSKLEDSLGEELLECFLEKLAG